MKSNELKWSIELYIKLLCKVMEVIFIFGSCTTYDRSTRHPKFNPNRIRIHDLQIMTVHFMSLRRLP